MLPAGLRIRAGSLHARSAPSAHANRRLAHSRSSSATGLRSNQYACRPDGRPVATNIDGAGRNALNATTAAGESQSAHSTLACRIEIAASPTTPRACDYADENVGRTGASLDLRDNGRDRVDAVKRLVHPLTRAEPNLDE